MSTIRTQSISKSLTISLVAAIVVISLAFSTLNYYLISEREKAWLRGKADESIRSIARTLEVPLWNIDRRSIHAICTYYSQSEWIEAVKLSDPSGEILYTSSYDTGGGNPYRIGRSRDIVYNGEVLGTIQITMTAKRSREFNREVLIASILGLIISVAGLAVSTGFLLKKFLRKPMDDLAEIVDAYSKGDYHPTLRETRYAEFEPLVTVVFDMGQKIESQMGELRLAEKQLKEYSDRLERQVARRTKELESANQSLTEEIAERKRTEEALREREERLQAILAASPDPMVMYDPEGTPVYLNPAFTELFGWTWEELQGRRIPFVPEDQVARTQEAIRYLYATGTTERFESKRYTKSGQALDVTVSAAAIKGPTGETAGMIVNLTDITRIRALQAQYEQAQSMKSIGTLAGGVAHDFNNLLMGIQGRTSLLSVDLPPSHPSAEHIRAIEDYIQSATNLTKQLLGFARGGKYEVTPTDLNELTAASAKMFGRTRKDIEVRTETHTALLVAEVDKRQIEQVLLNLFVNAWQAMPKGGRLYLRTAPVELDETRCKPHQLEPGSYARISITDTGVGMDEETRKRIFDPFFTTKEKTRGTGLGLASAYGIVKNHGGMITVKSDVGRGSTFDLFLPLCDKEIRQEEIPEQKLVRGAETVLLVDDEEMIRDVAASMLEKIGYRVIVSSSGEEAVDVVTGSGESIQIVVLDMIMPGMDGGETFDRIRALQPRIPVLLSSGYTIDGQATEILNRGCNGFIQKPFNLSELSTKIREILDSR